MELLSHQGSAQMPADTRTIQTVVTVGTCLSSPSGWRGPDS